MNENKVKMSVSEYGRNLRVLFSKKPPEALQKAYTDAGFQVSQWGANRFAKDCFEYPYYTLLTRFRGNYIDRHKVEIMLLEISALCLTPLYSSLVINVVYSENDRFADDQKVYLFDYIDDKVVQTGDRFGFESELIPILKDFPSDSKIDIKTELELQEKRLLDHFQGLIGELIGSQVKELKDQNERLLTSILENLSYLRSHEEQNTKQIRDEIEKEWTSTVQEEILMYKRQYETATSQIESLTVQLEDSMSQVNTLSAELKTKKTTLNDMESKIQKSKELRKKSSSDDYIESLNNLLPNLLIEEPAIEFILDLDPVGRHKLESHLVKLNIHPKTCIKNTINHQGKSSFNDYECTLGTRRNARIYWLYDQTKIRIILIE